MGLESGFPAKFVYHDWIDSLWSGGLEVSCKSLRCESPLGPLSKHVGNQELTPTHQIFKHKSPSCYGDIVKDQVLVTVLVLVLVCGVVYRHKVPIRNGRVYSPNMVKAMSLWPRRLMCCYRRKVVETETGTAGSD